jgi:hypothetical protein
MGIGIQQVLEQTNSEGRQCTRIIYLPGNDLLIQALYVLVVEGQHPGEEEEQGDAGTPHVGLLGIVLQACDHLSQDAATSGGA